MLPITDFSLFFDTLALDVHIILYVYVASYTVVILPALLSFSASHFYTVACTSRTIFVVTLLAHPVLELFGYEHPMTPDAIYGGMSYLLKALQLTREDMYAWCTELSGFVQRFNGFHFFLIGVGAAIVLWLVIRLVAGVIGMIFH